MPSCLDFSRWLKRRSTFHNKEGILHICSPSSLLACQSMRVIPWPIATSRRNQAFARSSVYVVVCNSVALLLPLPLVVVDRSFLCHFFVCLHLSFLPILFFFFPSLLFHPLTHHSSVTRLLTNFVFVFFLDFFIFLTNVPLNLFPNSMTPTSSSIFLRKFSSHSNSPFSFPIFFFCEELSADSDEIWIPPFLIFPSPLVPFNFCGEPSTDDDAILNLLAQGVSLFLPLIIGSHEFLLSITRYFDPRTAAYLWSQQCLFRYYPSSLLILFGPSFFSIFLGWTCSGTYC